MKHLFLILILLTPNAAYAYGTNYLVSPIASIFIYSALVIFVLGCIGYAFKNPAKAAGRLFVIILTFVSVFGLGSGFYWIVSKFVNSELLATLGFALGAASGFKVSNLISTQWGKIDADWNNPG